MTISENDIEILSYSVGIPSLTDKIVDDGFAYCLERDLNDNGFSTRWISLDDLGYISVCFNNLIITQEQIEAVIKYANLNLE